MPYPYAVHRSLASLPSMTDPLLVGVDVGSTNVKAVVYEPDGTAIARATTNTLTHYPRPGWAFYRAEELWVQVTRVLREAIGQVAEPRRIAGVAVASMGEAGVPLDARGTPTADVIAWFDTRTRDQAARLDALIGKDTLFARTGLSLEPIWSLCKLLWLQQHEPDAWRRTVRWLHVADYVAFRLCGVPATDASLASRTLALDLHRLRWDEEIIRTAGLQPDLFAPLVPGGTLLQPVTPEAARETGLPAGARVAAGGHDHVCGALAVGVTQPGTMLNSLGTAEALFLPLERPLTDPAVGHQGYTHGAHVVGGQPYVLAGQHTAGASIEWVRELLGLEDDDTAAYAALIAEAERVPPGSLGACFLPHLRLANPPHVDPKARGALVGLTANTGRAAVARAVIEGLALGSRRALEPLLTYPGVTAPREIVTIGGGTRNRLLMGIKATVLNHPFTVAEVDEATALGAALLGGLGAGVYADVPAALAPLRYTRSIVEPTADHVATYDAIYREVYQSLYATLASLNHTISDQQARLSHERSGVNSGGR